MSKYRRAARIDDNQASIVAALRKMPGVSVAVGHDDLLIGRNGRTYWFELKNPNTASKKTGEVSPSAVKQSQKDLLLSWKGHYEIVWSLDQILEAIK
jgi:hypothetical protein